MNSARLTLSLKENKTIFFLASCNWSIGVVPRGTSLGTTYFKWINICPVLKVLWKSPSVAKWIGVCTASLALGLQREATTVANVRHHCEPSDRCAVSDSGRRAGHGGGQHVPGRRLRLLPGRLHLPVPGAAAPPLDRDVPAARRADRRQLQASRTAALWMIRQATRSSCRGRESYPNVASIYL